METRRYTVAEIAARYQVKPGWVTDHATGRRFPTLPGLKIGKSWRFTDENLMEFENLCRATADQIAKRKNVRRVA